MKAAANNKCAVCGKTVYPIEQITALNKNFHKGCFKCDTCGVTLNLKNFKSGQVNGELKPFCQSHVPVEKPTQTAETIAMKSAMSAPKLKKAPGVQKNARTTFAPGELSPTTNQQWGVTPSSQNSTQKTDNPPEKKTTTVGSQRQTNSSSTSSAPAKQTTTTQTQSAPAKQSGSVTQGPAEIQDKSEVKRPAEAASFLKRSRHRFDFQSKLTPQQIDDFKKLFAVYDADKNGTINISELDEALFKLGFNFSPENLLTLHRIVDENKDGVLNFEEFLGLYDFLDFLKGLFTSADKDGSGKLNRKEINVLLLRAGYKFKPEQVELMYRMCDEDGTDLIELEDFLSLILFIFWAQILFSTTDTDGNDSVDIKEFDNLLLDLGIWMSPDDVAKFFKELDTDNSGTLNFEEYIELVFELRYPLISDLVRFDIKRTGVSAELTEHVDIQPDEKINLMEASGFLRRTRHRFNFESKLTDEQKEVFRNLFLVYDKDKSGTINIRELASVLEQLGYKFSHENIETIVFIVDDNLDGVLNFNEFLGLYDFLEYLKTLFETADQNKDGQIDRADLTKLLADAGYKFTEKQVELFYKMCDSDGSGVLEVYDFFELTLFIFWAQVLFNKADTDGNDVIDAKEFENVLNRLAIAMPPEGAAKYFEELDVDKDGHLKFEEYIELVFMLKFIDLILGGL